MKIFLQFFLIVIIFLVSCESQKQIDVCGESAFYVENLSNEPIVVSMLLLNGEKQEPLPIKVGETKRVLFIVEIGTNPSPELVFESLAIENMEGSLLYSQMPITNSAWTSSCINPKQSDYYHSDYFFTYK